MTTTSQIQRDLTDHFLGEFLELSQRHFGMARAVLPTTDIAVMAQAAARSMDLTMVGMIVGFADTREKKIELFDLTVTALSRSLLEKRDELLDRIDAEQRGNRARRAA